MTGRREKHKLGRMTRRPFIAVYILASGRNGTLYTGVTSDLPGRVYQHKHAMIPGFTARHGCKTLVWYEPHLSMVEAIARERAIKHWVRRWKLALIEADNPDWRDLSESWFDQTLSPWAS